MAVRGSACLLRMLCGCCCIMQLASAGRLNLPATGASVTPVHQAMQCMTCSAKLDLHRFLRFF